MLSPQLEFVALGINGVSGVQPRTVMVSSPPAAELPPPPPPLHALSARTADMPTARLVYLRVRIIGRIQPLPSHYWSYRFEHYSLVSLCSQNCEAKKIGNTPCDSSRYRQLPPSTERGETTADGHEAAGRTFPVPTPTSAA